MDDDDDDDDDDIIIMDMKLILMVMAATIRAMATMDPIIFISVRRSSRLLAMKNYEHDTALSNSQPEQWLWPWTVSPLVLISLGWVNEVGR
jgi:hypothetical protein